MENNTMNAEFKAVIDRVCKILNDNKEWQTTFDKYVNALNDVNLQTVIRNASNKFRLPKNLQLYIRISDLENNNDTTANFDVRYMGKSVANIKASYLDKEDVKIGFKKCCRNFKFVGGEKFNPEQCIDDKTTNTNDWFYKNSALAQKFKRLFKHGATNIVINEAACEYSLLKLMKHEHANSNCLNGIKVNPVMIAETGFFQMPTAISASHIKEGGVNKITYSGSNGGGIDILARLNNRLTIFELKKIDAIESPEVVIMQALAYATFLVKLIKYKGDDVLRAFNIGRNADKNKPIRHRKTINVCCLMSNRLKNGEIRQLPDFITTKTRIKLDDYTLELHYMYFDIDKDGNVSIARSSLIK